MIWWIIYGIVSLLWFVLVMWYYLDEKDIMHDQEKKDTARAALVAPLWPIILFCAVLYGLWILAEQVVKLVDDADLGEPARKAREAKQKEKENGKTQSEDH
jgi:hypothetical protein